MNIQKMLKQNATTTTTTPAPASTSAPVPAPGKGLLADESILSLPLELIEQREKGTAGPESARRHWTVQDLLIRFWEKKKTLPETKSFPSEILRTENIYRVKRYEVKNADVKGKTPFLTLVLADNTGEIDATAFFNTAKYVEDAVQALDKAPYVRGRGSLGEYNGKAQLKFSDGELYPVDPSRLEQSGLVNMAKDSPYALYEQLYTAAADFGHPGWKRLVQTILEDNKNSLLVWPAAQSVHEAYVGGLLVHLTNMLKIAQALCVIYPTLDHDLLCTGIILHDIGKILEFSLTKTGDVEDYSFEGILLGHLLIGPKYVERMIEKINGEGPLIIAEESTVLQHLIASHHGKPEWGAVKTPATLEAWALFVCDNADAKIMTAMEALDKASVPKGSFTPKVFPLDNTKLYKPTWYPDPEK